MFKESGTSIKTAFTMIVNLKNNINQCEEYAKKLF